MEQPPDESRRLRDETQHRNRGTGRGQVNHRTPDTMIYLATIPPYHRTRKGVSMIVKDYNLVCHEPGKGNRAKRRQGLYVHNPDHSKPFGLIAMDRGQIAHMLKTPAHLTI